MALPETKLLSFIILDQNLKNQAKKIKNSILAFFVNPPEGAEYSLKCIKSKIGQHIYFKNFLKVATLLLDQKNFQVKINSLVDFVF